MKNFIEKVYAMQIEFPDTFGLPSPTETQGKGQVYEVIYNVFTWLLITIGIVAVISLIIGGATYLTAYGDEKQAEKAKRIITYSIIGVVVSLSSLVIVKQIDFLLQGI